MELFLFSVPGGPPMLRDTGSRCMTPTTTCNLGVLAFSILFPIFCDPFSILFPIFSLIPTRYLFIHTVSIFDIICFESRELIFSIAWAVLHEDDTSVPVLKYFKARNVVTFPS
jgi:hypothetical protein